MRTIAISNIFVVTGVRTFFTSMSDIDVGLVKKEEEAGANKKRQMLNALSQSFSPLISANRIN